MNHGHLEKTLLGLLGFTYFFIVDFVCFLMDPGFFRLSGCQPLFWPFFHENCIKMNKNGSRGDTRLGFTTHGKHHLTFKTRVSVSKAIVHINRQLTTGEWVQDVVLSGYKKGKYSFCTARLSRSAKTVEEEIDCRHLKQNTTIKWQSKFT